MYKLSNPKAHNKDVKGLLRIASSSKPRFLESYSISKNGVEVYSVEHITIKRF
jgi:hypothetical protein